MEQKQPDKRTYQTDLRIKATPHQVARSLFKNDVPKQSDKQPAERKSA